MIVAASLSFLLLIAVAYLVAAPFLASGESGEEAAARLTEERGRVLAQVRDLDMEFQTGKLDEAEYRGQRTRRLDEVAAIDRAIEEALAQEALEESEAEEDLGEVGLEEPVSPNGHVSIPEDDEDLERVIEARKHTLETHACPTCGTAIDLKDDFCRRCGADLAAARPTRGA
jgi:hypothetical protein